MGEKVKAVPGKVKEAFGKLGKTAKRLIIAALVLLVVVIVVLVAVRLNKKYVVLFTGLNQEDLSSVVTYLDGHEVRDYRIENNDTILVPEGQEAGLKASIAMEKYPTSGFGYNTYLDNVGMLSTDADRKQLSLFDLQDRLGAAIRNLDGVQDANVTIAEGSDNRYILDEDSKVKASASVEVIMRGDETLSAKQVSAIRNLVGHAVSGLEIDDISIIDDKGNPYTSDEGMVATDSSQLKLALEAKVNNAVRANVLTVLEPVFGKDNLSISVNSNVDVSRTYTDATTYDLPDWAADGQTGGRGIIGSRVWDNSIIGDEDTTVGGTVGTSTNADLNEYMLEAATNGTGRELHASGEENFNVDTYHTQSDNASGIVTDLMVAVTINSTVADAVNMENLVGHVARAARIGTLEQDEKVSIFVAPFYTEPTQTPSPIPDGLPPWILYALIAGLVLFLILLLLILLLLRRSKKKKKKKADEEAAVLAAAVAASAGEAPGNEGADIMDLTTDRSMELRKDVRQFVQDNPEIAAQMVRSWLRGGDEDA